MSIAPEKLLIVAERAKESPPRAQSTPKKTKN
jgi:hypothetical protein